MLVNAITDSFKLFLLMQLPAQHGPVVPHHAHFTPESAAAAAAAAAGMHVPGIAGPSASSVWTFTTSQ